MSPPSLKCVVLVPAGHHIDPGCEDGLRSLEQRGYLVRRAFGDSAIDLARNQMASDALADGFEELIWVGPGVRFRPDDVDRLRSHRLPLVAGLYAKPGRRQLACAFLRRTEEVLLGAGGGLTEVMYVGLGFAYTHRVVYDRMFDRLKLPVCNERFGRALVPFFAPGAVKDGAGNGWWYLSEDFSFCARARQVEVRVMADTAIRLEHVGTYPYAWEDAGGPREAHPTCTFRVRPPEPPAPPDTPSSRAAESVRVDQVELSGRSGRRRSAGVGGADKTQPAGGQGDGHGQDDGGARLGGRPRTVNWNREDPARCPVAIARMHRCAKGTRTGSTHDARSLPRVVRIR